MGKSSRLFGTAGRKGCRFGYLYCFTREPDYQRCPRLDILRIRYLVSAALSSEVVQPTCDTEFFLLADWRNYLDELISTGKIISFATKADIDGYVFNPKTKEFLMMFHRKLGKWLAPGGHVEGGENTAQAALREVKEEIGVDLNLIEIKGELDEDGKDFRRIQSEPESGAFCAIEEFIHPIGAQDPHIHVDSIYVGTIASEKHPEKRNKDEVTARDWFPLSQIEQLNTFDNVPAICRAILRAMEE